MASPALQGSCGCGTIRFEIAEPLVGAAYCHCRACQKRTSHLFGRAPDADEFSIVRVAAIDGDPGVRPAARQLVASAAEWEPIPDDGLPRYDGVLSWR